MVHERKEVKVGPKKANEGKGMEGGGGHRKNDGLYCCIQDVDLVRMGVREVFGHGSFDGPARCILPLGVHTRDVVCCFVDVIFVSDVAHVLCIAHIRVTARAGAAVVGQLIVSDGSVEKDDDGVS